MFFDIFSRNYQEFKYLISTKCSLKGSDDGALKICKSVFWALSIVYISIKLQRFGSWIFFRLQVE
jgi:hypothetical protein